MCRKKRLKSQIGGDDGARTEAIITSQKRRRNIPGADKGDDDTDHFHGRKGELQEHPDTLCGMSFLCKNKLKRPKRCKYAARKEAEQEANKRGETNRVPMKAGMTQTICMAEKGSFKSILIHCVG